MLQYKPLNKAEEEIRLLRLQPPKPLQVGDRAELRARSSCWQMEHCSIKNPMNLPKLSNLDWASNTETLSPPGHLDWRYPWGDYVALSYTWGDHHNMANVEIDGCQVAVRSNLRNVLQILADKAPIVAGLRIWIDALCINQDDSKERQREVSRMRDIYERARDIVVWLGETADRSDSAMRLIQSLSRSCEDGTAESLGVRLKNDPDLLGTGCWSALGQLMNRPYWNRLWIMQEIAMGSVSTPILCGRECVSWGDVFHAIFTFIVSNDDIVFNLVQNECHHSIEGFRYSGLNRNRIIHFMNQQRALGTKENQHSQFMPLLDLARKALATDPRDKVYGLLGLMGTTLASKVAISYVAATRDVYVSFTRAMVYAGKIPTSQLRRRHKFTCHYRG